MREDRGKNPLPNKKKNRFFSDGMRLIIVHSYNCTRDLDIYPMVGSRKNFQLWEYSGRSIGEFRVKINKDGSELVETTLQAKHLRPQDSKTSTRFSQYQVVCAR